MYCEIFVFLLISIFPRNLRIIFTRNFGILVKFSHLVCEIFAFFASERNAKMKRNGREKKLFLLFNGNPSERSLQLRV